jgi:hypothetical protein
LTDNFDYVNAESVVRTSIRIKNRDDTSFKLILMFAMKADKSCRYWMCGGGSFSSESLSFPIECSKENCDDSGEAYNIQIDCNYRLN